MSNWKKYEDRKGNIVEAETTDGLTFRVIHELGLLEYDWREFANEYTPIEQKEQANEQG